MKNKIQTFCIMALSAILGVLGSYFFFCDEKVEETAPDRKTPHVRVVKTKKQGNVQKVTEISLVDRNGKPTVQIVQSEKIRPGARPSAPDTAADDDIDEENLSPAQKAVLKELQDALDDNDIRRVRKALRKFTAKVEDGGLGGSVPVCMRAKAVEALGWFGKDAAVDLIEYVADSNEDVSNDAFSAFEQALSDCEMGDVARAKLLKSMMTVMTDGEQVDTLLNQLNDMRNSVKVDAAKDILSNGSEAAKTKLKEDLESYFDEDVKDADSLDRWKAMNPDDPSDNDTYGGSK